MAYSSYNSRSYSQQSRETSAGLSRGRSPYYRHLGDSYDSRNDIPDRPSQNRPKSPPLTPPRERHVKHTSWPPPPSVEDERDSLAREYPPSSPSRSQDDGVKMRGTPDQDPIIVEVGNPERRFVLVPETKKIDQSKEKPAPLKTDVNNAEERPAIPRRQPSPYSYTPTTRERFSGEYFLSPDTLTPSGARTRKPASFTDDLFGSKHRQRSTESWLDSSNSRSRAEISDESDYDPRAASKLRSKQGNPRVSLSRTDSEPPARSVRKDVSASPRAPRTPSPYYENSSSAWKSEKLPERSSRPTSSADPIPPKPIPILKALSSENVHSGSPTRTEFARSASYTTETVLPPSPPRSPNQTGTQSGNNSPRGSQSSRSGSRPGSRPSSPLSGYFDPRQASAALSKIDGTQPDRYATYPPVQNQKPARLTPLSTSMRQEPIEKLSKVRTDVQSPQPLSVAKSGLPYPEDDHSFLMPTEVDFSPHHTVLGVPLPPMDPFTRSRSAIPPPTSSNPILVPNIRPDITSRHSSAPEGPSKANAEPTRSASFESAIKEKLQTSSSPSPVLPPCPRREYSKKHEDWYTIHGFESFNICPSCLEKIVLQTHLGKFFKRSPPRQSSVRTKCEFGSPWVRLAWLLTLKYKHQDLDLIQSLIKIADREPECPGASEAVGIMYGIQNDQGAFIPSFAICPLDKRNLETLFPTLIGAFTRFPSSVKVDRICNLRMNSKRFPKYLDVIVDIDDKARSSASRGATRKPDLQPLIDLASSFAYKQECQRDNILLDQTWHFPPSMPELTVCEECFDEVIYPAIKRGSSVAERFNKVLQPLVPAMGGKSSCQIYSPRMRRVWDRSVKNEDWEYLKRKVRERMEVENDLRAQQEDIQKMLQRGGGIYAGAGGVDRERLKRELDRIALEWGDWE